VLNSDEDIDHALGNISQAGVTVVRTWAFNDVHTIPVNGTWFQLIGNGTTTVNNGTNGLQKLDTVIQLAEKHGIFVQLSLTNNWNPIPNTTAISARDDTTNNSRPRNTLSNDYGGMDAYVRALTDKQLHDEFYTNPTILNTFLNYTTQIVTRYTNSPAVLGWELANDPRCNSSLSGSPQCNTNTITRWHSTVAQHISQLDPNHLITSGNQGFFCVDCPKLFPRTPQPSAAPSLGRRRVAKPITRARLLQERKAAWKKSRKAAKRSESGSGRSIRGRWSAPAETKRQSDQGVGPAFDGSSGVDSEDIINIPQVGYGTFQLFPDQNSYGPDDPSLSPFNNTVQQGLSWIQSQANVAQLYNKPVSLAAFGLVTQGNAASYVPFNTTTAPFGPDQTNPSTTTQPYGVTDPQRDDAYSQWFQAGLSSDVNAMNQYQWSSGNLTTSVGTAIQPSVSGTGAQSPVTGTGVSPNDGYGIQGQGQAAAVATISQVAQAYGPD